MIQINSAKRLSYRISLYIYSAMSAQNEMPPRPAATPASSVGQASRGEDVSYFSIYLII